MITPQAKSSKSQILRLKLIILLLGITSLMIVDFLGQIPLSRCLDYILGWGVISLTNWIFVMGESLFFFRSSQRYLKTVLVNKDWFNTVSKKSPSSNRRND